MNTNETLWVFSTTHDFGYVLVDSQERIYRMVTRKRLPWAHDVLTLNQLREKLKILADGRSRQLYCPKDLPEAPMCFGRLVDWLFYLDSGAKKERYCANCTAQYQARMLAAEKCGHPLEHPHSLGAAMKPSQPIALERAWIRLPGAIPPRALTAA